MYSNFYIAKLLHIRTLPVPLMLPALPMCAAVSCAGKNNFLLCKVFWWDECMFNEIYTLHQHPLLPSTTCGCGVVVTRTEAHRNENSHTTARICGIIFSHNVWMNRLFILRSIDAFRI